MKSPIDVVKGKIVDYNEKRGVAVIEAPYDDIYSFIKRGYKECNVQMIDSRPLSDAQRKACYALLKEISDFTGMGLDPTKEYMKLKFLAEDLQETGERIFSLSNAPMSLVCAFQRFLVRFILDWDIPTRFPLINFVDDVSDYLYACVAAKKCCVCGKHSDLHHRSGSRVGMGRDRTEIIHVGLEVLPLCREHHNEVHMLGEESFGEKYHIDKGVIVDNAIARIYGLKKGTNNA